MIDYIDVSIGNKIIKESIMKRVSKIIDSGQYIMGESLNQFETDFAKYCECKYAIGLNSGTDALRFALMALCDGEGDVLTVSHTFPATVMSILSVGANPIFVDVDKHGTMDVDDLKRKISNKTKAIIPVHFMGHMSRMDKIIEIANGIPVIEDACQSVGATLAGKKAGSFGDIGCFSFFPTKNLSCCGDGGAIVTSRIDLYDKIISLRNFGRTERDTFLEFGLNSRLDEIQASILCEKMNYIDEWLNSRRIIAKSYYDALKDTVEFIKPYDDCESSFHIFSIRVNDNNAFVKKMEEKGVDCRTHYTIPVHKQPFVTTDTILPMTDIISKENVSLPMSEFLSQTDQNLIINNIKEIVNAS